MGTDDSFIDIDGIGVLCNTCYDDGFSAADEEDDDDAAVVETRLTAEHLMTLPPQLPVVKVVARALAQHTIPALLTDICGQCYMHAKPVNKVECNGCGTVDCFRVTDGAGIVESSKKRKTMSYISDPVTPIARRDRRIGIGGGSISSSSYNGSTDRIRRCRAAQILDPDLEAMAGTSIHSITPAVSPIDYEDDGHLAQGEVDATVACRALKDVSRNNIIPAIVIPLVGEQRKIDCGHR